MYIIITEDKKHTFDINLINYQSSGYCNFKKINNPETASIIYTIKRKTINGTNKFIYIKPYYILL